MKKYLVFLIGLLSLSLVLGQAPEKFAYQGVARQSSGFPLANTPVTVKITLLEGSVAKYVETHAVTTNKFGLYTLEIGGGTVNTGSFSSINWSTSQVSVKVAIDGNDLGGEQQLLSVPYALYAKSSGSGGSGGNTTDELITDVKIGNDKLVITEGSNVKETTLANYEALPTPTSQGYLFYNTTNQSWEVKTITGGGTDSQDLSISGGELKISNGQGVFLSDLLPQGTANNQVLTWENGKWIAKTPTGGTSTDNQDLELSGTTLSLTNDNTPVDLSSFKELPDATGNDGKVLKVVSGQWAIGDDQSGGSGGTDDQTALEVVYDNSGSGLSSTTVQGALDEVAADISNVSDTDDQELTLSADNKLSIDDGNEVDLGHLKELPDATGNDGKVLKVVSGQWTIGDDQSGGSGGTDDQTALEVVYDNSGSGLSSTTVQAALDEVATDISNVSNTDNQNLTVANDSLTISGGKGVLLTELLPSTTSADDGKVIKWNESTKKWILATDAGGTSNTASNGLALSGTDIKLGGILSENTTIGGQFNYDLEFIKMKSLTVNSDEIRIVNPSTNTTEISFTKGTGSGIGDFSISSNLKYSVGAGVNKVLTSDANGNATWKQLDATSIKPGASKSMLVTNGSNVVEWFEPQGNGKLLGTDGNGDLNIISVGNGLTQTGTGAATSIKLGGSLSENTSLGLNGNDFSVNGKGNFKFEMNPVSGATIGSTGLTIEYDKVSIILDPNKNDGQNSKMHYHFTQKYGFQMIGNGNDASETDGTYSQFTMSLDKATGNAKFDGQEKLEIGMDIIIPQDAGKDKVLTSDKFGNATWETPTSGLWTGDATKMYYSTGIVGIGTNSPEETLDVNGAIRLQELSAAPSDVATRLYNLNGVLFWGSTKLNTAGSWSTGTNTTFTSDKVGIGLEPSAGYPLHVKGDGGRIGAYIRIDDPDEAASKTALTGLVTGGKGAGDNIGVNGIVVSSSGVNVGVRGDATGGSKNYAGLFGAGDVYIWNKLFVGGENPSTTLNVESEKFTTSSQVTIKQTGTAANSEHAKLKFENANGSQFWMLMAHADNVGKDDEADFDFYYKDRGQLMTLTGEGKLGIGLNPSELLEVNGNTKTNSVILNTFSATGVVTNQPTVDPSVNSYVNIPAISSVTQLTLKDGKASGQLLIITNNSNNDVNLVGQILIAKVLKTQNIQLIWSGASWEIL